MFTAPANYQPETQWNDAVKTIHINLIDYVTPLIWHHQLFCAPGLYSVLMPSHLPITTKTNLYHSENYRGVTHKEIASMTTGTIIDSNDYVICYCRKNMYSDVASVEQIAYRAATLFIQEYIEADFHTFKENRDVLSDYCDDDVLQVQNSLSMLVHNVDVALLESFDNRIVVTNSGPILTISILGDYRLLGDTYQ